MGSKNALASGISERFQFSFQSNIHPAGKPELVRWQWLSSHRSRGDLNAAQNDGHKVILGLHDRSDPFARVMVFSSHRKTSPYRFEKGDSGTAASVFVFPFGVLSTVDWEETEGVPVTTLPSAGAYSDEPSVLADESKTGQPGQLGGPVRTDASSEPGKGNGSGKRRGKGTADCAI